MYLTLTLTQSVRGTVKLFIEYHGIQQETREVASSQHAQGYGEVSCQRSYPHIWSVPINFPISIHKLGDML